MSRASLQNTGELENVGSVECQVWKGSVGGALDCVVLIAAIRSAKGEEVYPPSEGEGGAPEQQKAKPGKKG